jgi:hypothetical protein
MGNALSAASSTCSNLAYVCALSLGFDGRVLEVAGEQELSDLPCGSKGTDRVATPYSGLIRACFTTVPQRADSLRMNAPKSSGMPP